MKHIIIGSDHAGYRTKEYLVRNLSGKDIIIEDAGTYGEKPVDYPDIAGKVAKEIVKGKEIKGILVCGTGTGMVMAANKIKGARAAAIYDNYTAKMARIDNDANIACFRGRNFSREKALQLAKLFLNTPFSGKPRHVKRIMKISRMK